MYEDVWGSGVIVPCPLNLSCRWRSASSSGRFTPAKEPPVLIRYGVGWASEPAWTRWERDDPCHPVRSLVTIL